MKLIIVGCGRIGSELARKVLNEGHQVAIIDRSAAAFESLGADFQGRTICGDVLDQDVLARAGIEETDGLAAVTSDDATNFVVARMAKEIFRVPNVVARAYDPRRREAFEALGIRCIASSSWGAQRLTQILTHPGQLPILTLGHGEVSLVEINVKPAQVGLRLNTFTIQGHPVAVVRRGAALLPNPELQLQADDLVILSQATPTLKSEEA
jgi:trk system potassium uptake protein TrkA